MTDPGTFFRSLHRTGHRRLKGVAIRADLATSEAAVREHFSVYRRGIE